MRQMQELLTIGRTASDASTEWHDVHVEAETASDASPWPNSVAPCQLESRMIDAPGLDFYPALGDKAPTREAISPGQHMIEMWRRAGEGSPSQRKVGEVEEQGDRGCIFFFDFLYK